MRAYRGCTNLVGVCNSTQNPWRCFVLLTTCSLLSSEKPPFPGHELHLVSSVGFWKHPGFNAEHFLRLPAATQLLSLSSPRASQENRSRILLWIQHFFIKSSLFSVWVEILWSQFSTFLSCPQSHRHALPSFPFPPLYPSPGTPTSLPLTTVHWGQTPQGAAVSFLSGYQAVSAAISTCHEHVRPMDFFCPCFLLLRPSGSVRVCNYFPCENICISLNSWDISGCYGSSSRWVSNTCVFLVYACLSHFCKNGPECWAGQNNQALLTVCWWPKASVSLHSCPGVITHLCTPISWQSQNFRNLTLSLLTVLDICLYFPNLIFDRPISCGIVGTPSITSKMIFTDSTSPINKEMQKSGFFIRSPISCRWSSVLPKERDSAVQNAS